MANNETRILKSNTIEELRQKNNEVSLHLGDNALLDSLIADKTESFTATSGQKLFTSSTLRFEIKPDESIDNTSASESYNVGVLKVYKDGTEVTQGIASNQFIVPLFSFEVTLTGSPTIPSEFIEDAVLTQSGGFSGTLLSADSTTLRFKSTTGTFSASQNLGIPHTDANKRVNASAISAGASVPNTYGKLIELNTGATAGEVIKIVSGNLVEAINEVQDDVGDISTISTNIPGTRADVVTTINSLKGEVGNAVDLTTSAGVVVTAINEHETDIGSMSLNTTASNLTAAVNELEADLFNAEGGDKRTLASLVTTDKTSIVDALNEVHNDALASVKLSSGTEQTINSDIQFTSGNTLEFPSGTTLDIRNGLLQTGAGGFAVTTGFIDFNADIDERGLSFERSNFGNGADVKLYWDEAHAASQPDRGFRVDGLDTGSSSQTADLVTFYNAQDLIANNTETGISVAWDSTNQNFDFALTADPTIQLGNDLSGSVTLTNLATGTYTLTATINAGTVENSMLAGSIAASKLAGSIGNSKLTNSSWTITDGTNSTPVNLGDTLTIQGTSGEIEVVENSNTVTVGLPNNVDVDGNLVVGGNLTVQGTQTILNTETLTVEDTLVLAGNNLSSEPNSGGFGLEVGPITSPSGVASGVTGAHSIVYNYSTDQWEADGSLILSEATQGVPGVKVTSASNPLSEQDLGQNKAIDFNEGSGITILGAASGNDIDVTITNSDKGSDQFIFRNIAVSGQSTIIADDNDGTLTVVGGTGITALTNAGTDTLTIQDSNSGVSAGSYGGQFVVPSITVNEKGRITSASNNTAISLSALGYSGVSNADNYGSFNIKVNTGSTEAIGSGETITFTDSGATTITRSQNTIDISSTDTQYSLADGSTNGLSSNDFTTTLKNKLDGIAASANNFNFNVSHNGGTGVDFGDGGTLNISAGSGIGVTRSGNSYTITNSNQHVGTNLGLNAGTGGRVLTSSTGTDVTIPEATSSASGFMSTAHHDKLDGIASGANNFSLPSNTVTNASVSGSTLTLTKSSGATVTFTDTNTTYTASSLGLGTSNSVRHNILGIGVAASSTAGRIDAANDIVAYSSSDERLKENITPLENALSKVLELNGVEFDWKELSEEEKKTIHGNEGHDVGVIAQDVEKVLPEVVTERETGYKAVKYEKLVPLLIEAIKEQQKQIEELKSINKEV